MARSSRASSAISSRAGVISRVTEPLGFFVLAVLIIEALIGGVSSFSDASTRPSLILSMVVLLGIVIVGVFLLAFFRPNTVGLRSSATIVLALPRELAAMDITQISWEPSKCFVNYSNKRRSVVPALSPIAPSFEITLNPDILSELNNQPIDIELTDENGLIWVVRPFHIHQRPVTLVCKARMEKVLEAYGSEQ